MKPIAAKVLAGWDLGDPSYKVERGEPVAVLEFCYDQGGDVNTFAIIMDPRGRIYRVDVKALQITVTKELRECLAETSLTS